MDAMLFLIGVQELGRWKEGFTKEEKQDLMHIAVCRLFTDDGHYEFVGRDGKVEMVSRTPSTDDR